jgi:hypothetical protein
MSSRENAVIINSLVRQALTSRQEVIGDNSLNAVLRTSGLERFKSNPQVDARLDESGDRLAYIESTCAICHGRHADTPICYLYVGSISEAVKWATGKEHDIVETHCLAKGDPYCRFEVGEARE